VNIKHKLGFFRETVLHAADGKVLAARGETEKEIVSATGKMIIEAENEANDFVSNAKYETDREINKKINAVLHESKRRLNLKRKDILCELFAEARNELKSFAESENYLEFLNKKIKCAVEKYGGEFNGVAVTKRDADLIKRSANQFGLRIQTAGDEIIGGFCLLAEDGRVKADMTFENLLAEAGERLLFFES